MSAFLEGNDILLIEIDFWLVYVKITKLCNNEVQF